MRGKENNKSKKHSNHHSIECGGGRGTNTDRQFHYIAQARLKLWSTACSSAKRLPSHLLNMEV